MDLGSSRQFRASLLRAGDRAEICSISGPVGGIGLSVGDRVVAGPRSQDGNTWILENGDKTVRLSHQQADQILVRLIV